MGAPQGGLHDDRRGQDRRRPAASRACASSSPSAVATSRRSSSAPRPRGIRVVDVRDEVNAVFAADAVARLTGVPGVAAVTAGPGRHQHHHRGQERAAGAVPVVLLGGATATVLRGRGALQDIDQLALIRAAREVGDAVTRVRDLVPVARAGVRASRARACPGRCSSSAGRPALPEELGARVVRREGGERRQGLAATALRLYLRVAPPRAVRAARSEPSAAEPPSGRRRPRPSAGAVEAARRGCAKRARGRCSCSAARRRSRRRRWPRPRRGRRARSACPSTCRAWRAACSAPSIRCGSATSASEALREADLVILAGVPVRLPPRLRPARQPRGPSSSSVNRSARRHAQEPAARCRRCWRRRALPASAGRGSRGRASAWTRLGLETLRGRDDERESEIDRQAAAVRRAAQSRCACCRRSRRRSGARQRARRRRRRLRGHGVLHPASARAALLARSRACSAPSAWAAGFALGAKLVRPEPRSGSSTATARSATA